MSLFNIGSSTAYNVRLEPENSTRIEPRTFHQYSIEPQGISDRFKVIRAGGARVPTIRILWQDKERNPHSVIQEVYI